MYVLDTHTRALHRLCLSSHTWAEVAVKGAEEDEPPAASGNYGEDGVWVRV
jgi:hypothetical protein